MNIIVDVMGKYFINLINKITRNKTKVCMIGALILLNGVTTAFASDMSTSTGTDNVSVSVPESIEPPASLVTPPLNNIPIIYPNKGIITSKYGNRIHPVYGVKKGHKGLDLSYPVGTSIMSPANGIVLFSGWKRGYGFVVEVDHGNGYISLFAHNKINLVKIGDHVTNATIIAKVGATGIATGPHVHIEIIFHGKNVNPVNFIKH